VTALRIQGADGFADHDGARRSARVAPLRDAPD
jgi:hypothetical protein